MPSKKRYTNWTTDYPKNQRNWTIRNNISPTWPLRIRNYSIILSNLRVTAKEEKPCWASLNKNYRNRDKMPKVKRKNWFHSTKRLLNERQNKRRLSKVKSNNCKKISKKSSQTVWLRNRWRAKSEDWLITARGKRKTSKPWYHDSKMSNL